MEKYLHLYALFCWATHSSILAWEIVWTEEPGGLQPMGSQRIVHDLATEQQHAWFYLSVCVSLFAK